MVVAPDPQRDVNGMTGGFGSFLPSIVVLGIAGMIAFSLTVNRSWAGENLRLIPGAVRLAVVAVFSQAAHFTEELLTGFHEQLPALFGLEPMLRGVQRRLAGDLEPQYLGPYRAAPRGLVPALVPGYRVCHEWRRASCVVGFYPGVLPGPSDVSGCWSSGIPAPAAVELGHPCC